MVTERTGPGAGALAGVRGGEKRDRLWPTIIVVGLVVVVLVNALFICIAVKGADTVVPSYTQGDR